MKMLRQISVVAVIMFFVAVGTALACGCGGIPGQTFENIVETALTSSNVVFQGKVIGFEYRKGIPNDFEQRELDIASKPLTYKTMFVRFRVDIWWKGDLADEIVLVTDQTLLSDGRAGTTSCEFDFKKGETYLVFAGLNKAAAMPQTNNCTLTRPANDVDGSTNRIRKILGEGTSANKKESQ